MKSFTVIFIFILFSYFNCSSQTEMIQTSTGKHLIQLSVIKNNVVVTGREDYMVKSIDACNSLTLCYLPGPPGFQNYLYRVDTNVQYLLSSSFPAYNNKIFKSVDSGNNWTLKLDTSGLIVQSICFFDSLEGMGFSTFSKVIRTTNGGNSWKPFVYSSLPAIITAFKLFGDSTICIGGLDGPTGSILISKDRGNTWPLGWGFKNGTPTDFFFLNKDTIFGISSNGKPDPGYARAYFAKSFNGGTTWTNTGIQDHYIYSGMFFKSAKEGYIVGANDLSEGIISKTINMGETWETFNTHIKSQLLEIEFLNDSIALISGTEGVLFKWNSRQSIFTGIDKAYPDNLELRIFPNPVKEKLFLESTEQFETIQIINTLGQEVYSMQKPQNTEAIDLSFLPSGIYYLKAESTSGQKVFKILKQH